MKVICLPEDLIPSRLDIDATYFSMYSIPQRENVGYFGSTLIQDIQRNGIRPSVVVWDFNSLALAVAAADHSIPRKTSADGWTRQIELTVHLCNPAIWDSNKRALERVLKFLTGDFWSLTFNDQGVPPPRPRTTKRFDCDCVSLLSGGLDSLVGAIDLTEQNQKPIFVSQIVRGDAETQRVFANSIRPESPHFQWNHKIHPPEGESEGSTRGRSIVFYAFAALAAIAIDAPPNLPVKIFVPENGYISLNIPLTPGRLGSFSTKTSHPILMKGIQSIWDAVGIKNKLIMPYQFKTKGEMLLECKNQDLLKELVFRSVSCGKYRVYKMQHCGRCIPCLVRRAAFKKWQESDNTVGGYYSSQLERINYGNPDDVGAIANACLRVREFGLQQLVSGNLSFVEPKKRNDFENLIARGLEEVEQFLREKAVI